MILLLQALDLKFKLKTVQLVNISKSLKSASDSLLIPRQHHPQRSDRNHPLCMFCEAWLMSVTSCFCFLYPPPRLCSSARGPLQTGWQGGGLSWRNMGLGLQRRMGRGRCCSGLQTAGQRVREYTRLHICIHTDLTLLLSAHIHRHRCYYHLQHEVFLRNLTRVSMMELWWQF